MDVGRRQPIKKSGGVFAAGPVLDDRMKSDHVNGGVKVKLNAEDEEEQDQVELVKECAPTRFKKAPVPTRGTRRTWSRAENGSKVASPNQIVKASRSVSVDGNQCKVLNLLPGELGSKKTSPGSLRKTRSEVCKSLVLVGDGRQSDTINSPKLREVMSTPSNAVSVGNGSARPARIAVIEDENSGEKSSRLEQERADGLQLEVSNSKVVGLAGNVSVENGDGVIPADISKIKESDECQEKVVTSSSSNVDQVVAGYADENTDDDEAEEEESDDGEVEMEKRYDVKEVNVPEKKMNNFVIHDGAENGDGEDVKVSQVPKPKATQLVKQPPRPTYTKRSAFYSDFNKSSASPTKPFSNSSKPVLNLSTSKSGSTKPSSSSFTKATTVTETQEYQRRPTSRDRLQTLVDLVLWRDVSRSAFVFGIGTFVIISSSYTKDLNISFISATSYVGLVYLALRFLFRSVLNRRGDVNVDDSDYIVGEEEAAWILKLVLPYFNEFLLSLRALFSGDPATTMKLALVLFVLARCGSSITIWKMAKLGFIGVFTVPKVVSTYSFQLKTHCKFWAGRFMDAWDSCAHKKVVAGIIFTLIWNLCSVVARIWALFMLAVAFRYYQQSMFVDEEWVEEGTGIDRPVEQGGEVGVSETIKEKKTT